MLNSDVQVPFPDHVSHPIDDVNISQILDITNIGGRLVHYVLLEGGKKTLMPSTLTNVLVPQLVIEFYQKKIFFVNIYNQSMRPIKKNMRRHARKSTKQRVFSSSSSSSASKLLQPPYSTQPQQQLPQPTTLSTKFSSLLAKPKPLFTSLAKSLTCQLQAKAQSKTQSTPVVIKTKPKPLSKQLQDQRLQQLKLQQQEQSNP
ncbi:uncharacterized protein LOC128394920 [Panonychus citri]|uniref:uncharacterized protein LOC128394920 n=1 Tax=Panonychus citri TaxID=50023 RepID=UPI002306E249|nr:uncharacterized protein LOC128394920 [Panonychus citri]